MIGPAPGDFWDRVIERVARLLMERETRVGGAMPPKDTPDIEISSQGRQHPLTK